MFTSTEDPLLKMGTTLAILSASGNFPDVKERLIISQSGKMIRSGINFNKSTGKLFGPRDLFGRLLITSKTSSHDIKVTKKLNWLRFFRNVSGLPTGFVGTVFSILGPILTKKNH